MDNTATARPTTHFKGDKAVYTGKVESLHGGTFYEVELLEGYFKGSMRLVVAPPALVEKAPVTTRKPAIRIALDCQECGKVYRVSPNNPDPQCPQCGSVDYEVR